MNMIGCCSGNMKPIGIIVRTKIENVEFFSENPVVEIVDFFPQHRGLPQLGINLNKVSRQAAQTVRSYSRILGGKIDRTQNRQWLQASRTRATLIVKAWFHSQGGLWKKRCQVRFCKFPLWSLWKIVRKIFLTGSL